MSACSTITAATILKSLCSTKAVLRGVFLAVLLNVSGAAHAATRSWDGGGVNNLWSNPTNWDGDVTAPTHYVLRSNITAPLGTTRLTVSLAASGIGTAPGVVRGGALRCLDSLAPC